VENHVFKGVSLKNNNTNQSKSNSTKGRLLEAALSEFTQKGYLKTGVKSITRKADVSYGTFYSYFNNKADLLVQLQEERWNPLTEQIKNKKAWINSENLEDFTEPIKSFFHDDFSSSGLHKACAQGFVFDKNLYNLFIEGLKEIADIFVPKIKSQKRYGAYSNCDENIISHILATALVMTHFLHSIGTIQCHFEKIIKNLSYFLFASLNFKKRMVPGFGKNAGCQIHTRGKILTVAKKEFALKGYIGASVSDIVEKAGFSRGTFYKHFKNKDDLVRNIFFDILSPINPFGGFSDEISDHSGFLSLDYLEKMIGVVYEGFNTAGDLKWTILQGIYYSDRLNDNLGDFLIIYSSPIISKIELLKEQGKCPNVDSSIISQILLAVIGYMAFMITTNMIQCSKSEFLICMSRVLYSFFHFIPEFNIE
jgi:AcrR family transcriptional regulator